MTRMSPVRILVLALTVAVTFLIVPEVAQARTDTQQATTTDSDGNKVATSGVVGGVKVVVNSDGMLVPAPSAGTSKSTTAAALSSDSLNLLPLITGRLVDAAGLGAAGVEVQLYKQVPMDFVDDGAGGQDPTFFDLDPVDTALTDGSGFFTGFAALIDPVSNYELRAVVGDEEVAYDFTPTVNGLVSGILTLLTPAVAVINASTGPLNDPLPYLQGLGSLVPQFILNLINGLFGDGSNAVVSAPEGYEVSDASDAPGGPPPTEPASQSPMAPAAAVSSIDFTPCPTGWHLGYKKVSGSKYTYLPTRFTHTALKSTQTVTFYTDKKTKGGVAFSLNGKLSSGGVQYGTETDGSTDFSWAIPYDDFATQYVEWRYDKYQEMCWYYNLKQARSDGRVNVKWVLAEPAGGSTTPRENPWGPGFSCAHTSSIGANTKLTTSTTTTFTGYFSVIGVSLNASQTQSTQTSVTIKPKTGVSAKYCMTGASLGSSALFEEIRQ